MTWRTAMWIDRLKAPFRMAWFLVAVPFKWLHAKRVAAKIHHSGFRIFSVNEAMSRLGLNLDDAELLIESEVPDEETARKEDSLPWREQSVGVTDETVGEAWLAFREKRFTDVVEMLKRDKYLSSGAATIFGVSLLHAGKYAAAASVLSSLAEAKYNGLAGFEKARLTTLRDAALILRNMVAPFDDKDYAEVFALHPECLSSALKFVREHDVIRTDEVSSETGLSREQAKVFIQWAQRSELISDYIGTIGGYRRLK